ncbi:hypothetical protein HZB08_00845 [Candidatus Saganbacteria bacterium]|uniref:Uncharacterized protein n=1 Tax=Candidatus Saganbacteria bacterium TaxID=2575572 RepID=A0A9D6UMW9_UNCSA|nr:hypothetical protein [Candidatus Saganbacteria bacterium]
MEDRKYAGNRDVLVFVTRPTTKKVADEDGKDHAVPITRDRRLEDLREIGDDLLLFVGALLPWRREEREEVW